MFNGELVEIMLKSGKMRRDFIIYSFASGSSQHGARLEGKSDLDVAGVYIGTREMELAIGNEDPKQQGHVTLGTSDQYEKNSAADRDVKAYSLRRWAGLAIKGDPTVLSYLFANPRTIDQNSLRRPAQSIATSVWATHIQPNRELFLSSSHTARFLGLGDSQYKRMLGLQGAGKHGQRDELIDAHGYDTKAAMHMIRSMSECLEYLQTGHMTFPRPDVAKLLDIRAGNWGLESIKKEFLTLREAVVEAEKTSPLPPTCDRVAINKIVASAICDHWQDGGSAS
jgi:predicted nucleotidyltransferase